MQFRFVQLYCQTILEIIEEKPNFTIPIQIYQLIILIFFLQLQGYCLTNYESQPVLDQKIGSAARLNEIASLTFALFQKGNDLITTGFYAAVQITIYSYFLYVGVLSYLMNKKKYIYQKYSTIFKKINQVLNTYFTLYDWIFFIPIMEINFGMIYCGRRSFLVTMREDGCSIPIYYKIIGYVGILLGLITSSVTSFFFRNYEFDEQNKLKRKFQIFISSIITILKCSLSFFYYLDIQYTDSLKFMLSIILSVVILSDSIWNVPFRDHQILKFYSTCSSYYFSIAVICTLWIFSDKYVFGYELFYYIILIGIVCQGVVLILVEYRYNSIIKGNYSNKNKNVSYIISYLDILLEYIVKLSYESTHNEESKCQLIEIIMLHKQNCLDNSCICHNSTKNYTIKRKRVDLNYICNLINCIFLYSLNQKEIIADRDNMENLVLKYISFLSKFYGNSPKAYYELKYYLQKRKKISSYYFLMISKVLSYSIEKQIDTRRTGSIENYGNNKASAQSLSQRNQELTVYTLLSIDDICSKYIPIILNCIQLKIQFWNRLLQGFQSMDEVVKHSISIIEKLNKVSIQFLFKMKQINRFVQQYDSYQLKKLNQIFYLVILNDTEKAQLLEEEGNEIKNRDMLKNIELIHTATLTKKSVQTIIISLSNKLGQIVSKKDTKFLEFFGYGKESANQLNRVNDLMPQFISKLHDQFLNHYIQRGNSSRIQNNFSTFIQLRSGFIESAKMYIDYVFTSQDDFQMAGTILKYNSSYDYLVFNRQGVIVGITKNILTKLFSQTQQIPSPNSLVNKYFTFLIFSEILKTFRFKREEILNSIQNGDYNVQLDASKKGFFSLNESYDENFIKFLNYIEYSKKNQKDVKNFVEFDELDLLDEKTLDFLDQFQAFKLLSHSFNKISTQSVSSKALKNKLQWSNESRSLKLFTIKLFFKYTLHMNQFDLNKQYGSENKEQYFILKFHDLTISKKALGQKMKFTKSMITYLGATTSIGHLSQFGSQVSSKFPTLTLNLSKDLSQLRSSNSSNPTHSKFKDIPLKMISSLVKMKAKSNALNQLNNLNEKQEETPYKNKTSIKILSQKVMNQISSKNIKKLNEENKQPKSNHSRKSNVFKKKVNTEHNISENDGESNADHDSSSGEDEDEEEIEGENKEKEVFKLLQGVNLKEEYNKSNTKTLTDEVLRKFTLNEEIIQYVDPNHQIKKVLQSNTRLSKFSVALENAIIECQMEMIQEQQLLEKVKSLISQKESSAIQSDQHESKIGSQNVISQRNSQIDCQNNLQKQEETLLNSQQIIYQTSINIQESGSKQSIAQESAVTLFRSNSQETSPIIKLTDKSKFTLNKKKSQFVNNYSKYLSQDLIVKEFLQDQNTTQINETSQKPIFQNPDELVYTFRDSIHRVDTPSLSDVEREKDASYANMKTNQNKSSTAFKNQFRKIQQEDDCINEQENSDDNDDQNLEFKFQKSLDQNEDMDGQIEEVRTIKQKKQKTKSYARSIYNQSVKQSTKNKTHMSMSQYNIQLELLQEKGMKRGEGDVFEGSMKSSSSSTRVRYGGNFLKEILKQKRIPIAARQYSLLMTFYFFTFIALNFINLNIIQTSMNDFRNYVAIIKVPRQLQRQYSIEFMGEYTKYKLKTGYLTDTQDQQFLRQSESYKVTALNKYNAQITNNSRIISESWESIKTDELYSEQYVTYQNQIPDNEEIHFNIVYDTILTKMLLLQKTQTQTRQLDSFLFMRKNYLTFTKDVLFQLESLIVSITNTIDSLTSQIILTTMCAIISIVTFGIIYFPIVYQINKYQEQIILIVSKIYKEQAEIERNKYQIMKQLIDIEKWDWLKYNYNGILWMRFDQFDLKNLAINNKQMLNKPQQGQNKRSLTLQSLIKVQKLSLFSRIWKIQLMVLISIAYFAVVIMYINTQSQNMKFPVLKNKNTLNTHLSMNNVKICSDIVAFDRYLQNYIDGYDISDLQLFQKCIFDNLEKLKQLMDENESLVYDNSNSLPAANRNIAKGLFEGDICSIVVDNPCIDGDPTNKLGLSHLYQIMQRCTYGFPLIFNYTMGDPLSETNIKNYLNDDCYKLYIFQSFKRQDETVSLFSTNINGSISTVADDVSNFLTQYLTIIGVTLIISIGIFLISHWILLKRRLYYMNLMLTLVPEEKLSEEQVLNMLKTLRYQ